jgi:glyoxylase-like metal-dependent hydrolase (beta-lactamase superfamily II)
MGHLEVALMSLLAGSLVLAAVAVTPVAAPAAFPAPGTYPYSLQVTLRSATPGARIHYTIDGSEPTATSPAFDPQRPIPLAAVSEGGKGQRREYTVAAVAVAGGATSAAVRFAYVTARRDKDAYVSTEMRPGVFLIADDETDKLFLVKGTRRALLIDTGMGGGDLRGYVGTLAGGLPLDVVITHAHPDHVALLGQFLKDHDVYMSRLDLPMLERFKPMLGGDVRPERIKDVGAGFVFDLGDRKLVVHDLPGHTPGSIVLMDEAAGILWSGDAVGSNRPAIPDAAWMQMPGMPPIDVYLPTLQAFRARVRGRVKAIFTGHNDGPLVGETYLDNLQRAAQKLVDEGPGILEPSLRPQGAWWVVVGDRLGDPDWAAINVSKETCLSTPPGRIATLSLLEVTPGSLAEPFEPTRERLAATVPAGAERLTITATTTSTRARKLTIDGVDVRSGSAHVVRLKPGDTALPVLVTSPDGTATRAYTLTVARRQD